MLDPPNIEPESSTSSKIVCVCPSMYSSSVPNKSRQAGFDWCSLSARYRGSEHLSRVGNSAGHEVSGTVRTYGAMRVESRNTVHPQGGLCGLRKNSEDRHLYTNGALSYAGAMQFIRDTFDIRQIPQANAFRFFPHFPLSVQHIGNWPCMYLGEVYLGLKGVETTCGTRIGEKEK